MSKLSISEEVGATVFAILAGFAVLCFTAWVVNTGGCSDTSGEKISPVPEEGEG